ncbi:MAG: hypothetical protein HY208_06140 [Nitrospirae bacterium]|nr:hypothetical protein [Nitrospirota bacterium]
MAHRLAIGLFLVALLSPIAGGLVISAPPLGENRRLAATPEVTWAGLRDASFFSAYERYFNDHFIYRRFLTRAKNWIDFHLFRVSPATKVHVGLDGWLYLRESFPDPARESCDDVEILTLAKQLHELDGVIDASGRTFFLILAPDKPTIYPEYVGPLPTRSHCAKSRYQLLVEALAEFPVKHFVRLDLPLLHAKAQQQLYYRTDTHWNPSGSMIVAETLLQQLSPSRWREYVPTVDLDTTPSFSGDLSRMLALDLKESAPFIKDIRYQADVHVTTRKSLNDDRPWFRITAVPPTEAPLLPKTILYRDSFMSLPLEMIKGSFTRLDAVWTYDMLDPDAADDLRTSRLVLFEMAERYLPLVSFDVPAIAAALRETTPP